MATTNHIKRTAHGLSKTRAYSIWKGIRKRCYNPACKRYADYGGRGIYVAARWASFSEFFADMGERPIGASLDRIDNDGPYSKENCRWTTAKEQARNSRRAMLLTYNGVTKCTLDWAAELGVPYRRLHARIRRGWPHKDAIETPYIPQTAKRRRFRAAPVHG